MTPCTAEVRCWPSVYTIGKMTKPVAAETPSRILGRLRSGSPWRITARSGIASSPASTVRRQATTSGCRSSSASRVAIGVAPQTTITPTATATGTSAERAGGGRHRYSLKRR